MKNNRIIIIGFSSILLLLPIVTCGALMAWDRGSTDQSPYSSSEIASFSLVDRLATIDANYLTRPPTVGLSPTAVSIQNQMAGIETPLATISVPQIEPVTHLVQSGDNLFQISQAYDVTVEAIMQANGLVGDGLIYTGQILVIPAEAQEGNQIEVLPESTVIPSTETPIPPTNTPAPPTDTPPPPTETPSPTPPLLRSVNGIKLEQFLTMPENVQENARSIFVKGQTLGRNPNAYSKVGDSTIENPHFMARFDEGFYDLGEYAYLQGTIEQYAGSHSRQGLAVRRGNHAWTLTDPMWADKSLCQANETQIACEIRVHNPSLIIFRLGSNDRGVPGGFDQNLRQAVQIAIDSGVIPVLGTKADRFEGSNTNNEIIYQIALDFQVPLWDFDILAGTIPGRGLDVDLVHLTSFYAHDYTSPTAYQRGHGVHNLTALMVLDAIWKDIILGSGE